jgi:hypothetical protein
MKIVGCARARGFLNVLREHKRLTRWWELWVHESALVRGFLNVLRARWGACSVESQNFEDSFAAQRLWVRWSSKNHTLDSSTLLSGQQKLRPDIRVIIRFST